MNPEDRERFLAAMDEREGRQALEDADRAHVLVSVLPSGNVGAVVGPFPDLWEALAYAPAWEAELGDPGFTISAHVMFGPGE